MGVNALVSGPVSQPPSPSTTPDGVSAQFAAGIANMAGSWQLAAGHYVPAKFPLEIVAPRPDTETASGSFYRTATANMAYRRGVHVRGGAFPFKFELLQGPSGATVGETLTIGATHTLNDEYGEVRWPSPTSGTHTFQVRVTDQEGATQDVTWTVTLDESAHVWVDSVNGDDGTGDGTFGNPLKTFEIGLWKSSDADSTYAGKIAVFRAGTYSVNGDGLAGTSNASISGSKPSAFMGYEGETVTFNHDNGHFDGSWNDDQSFRNITHTGGKSTAANVRLIGCFSSKDRLTFQRLTFKDVTFAGTAATDNPCQIWMPAVATRTYLAISRCQLDNTKMTLTVVFHTQRNCVEYNTCINSVLNASNGDTFISMKDACDFSSVTMNESTDLSTAADSFIWMGNQNGGKSQETRYNKIYGIAGGAGNAGHETWNQATDPGNVTTNTYSYRNTFVRTAGDRCMRMYDNHDPGNEPTISANALGNPTGTGYIFGDGFWIDGGNIAYLDYATDFDSNGNLTGAARTTYLGTVGAEIANPPDATYTALTAHTFDLGTDGQAGNAHGEMTSYVAGPPVRNEYSNDQTGPFGESITMKLAAKGGGTYFGGNIAHGSETLAPGDSIWWRVYHYFPTAYCQGDQGGGDQVAFLKWLAIYFDDGATDARRLTFQIGGGVPTNSCALSSAAPTMKHVATEALGTGSPLNLAWGTEQLIPRDQWVALQWMAYLDDENNGYVRAWMDDTYLGQADGRTISSNASYRTIAKMKFGDYWNGTCYQDTSWYVSNMIFTKEAPNTLDSGGRPYIHPSHKAQDV